LKRISGKRTSKKRRGGLEKNHIEKRGGLNGVKSQIRGDHPGRRGKSRLPSKKKVFGRQERCGRKKGM